MLTAVNLQTETNAEPHEEGERTPAATPAKGTTTSDRYIQSFYDTTYR